MLRLSNVCAKNVKSMSLDFVFGDEFQRVNIN